MLAFEHGRLRRPGRLGAGSAHDAFPPGRHHAQNLHKRCMQRLCLSPLGWTQEVRPASDYTWWLLLACPGLTLLLIVIANLLLAHRDFGMGLIPPKPGPARGGLVATIWG